MFPPQYQLSQRTEAKSTHVLDRKSTNKTKTKSCEAKTEIVGRDIFDLTGTGSQDTNTWAQIKVVLMRLGIFFIIHELHWEYYS